MHVRNLTTGATVAVDAREAASFWSRFRGLMFRRNLHEGEALVIRAGGAIHMMFMFFPIDAVFIDEEGRVTAVARRVKPWIGLASGGKGSKAVIEMAAGAAGDTERGHQLVVG
jgi:uncharacterized membrane protein (UPF0127 family)